MKRIQIASLKRRILSALIDTAIIASLMCLFYFCVFSKIVASVNHFDDLNNVVATERMDSGLYVNKDKTYLEEYPSSGETKLEPIVRNFYIDYLNKKDKTYDKYWYFTHILYLDDVKKIYPEGEIVKPERVIFEWNGTDDYQKKNDTKQSEADFFFQAAFGSATYSFLFFDPVKTAENTMAWGNARAVLYASIVATIIPCFIIPISLKNGKTIGKLITKLVVLTDEGYEYKRYKHIFRYLAFYFLEFFGGVMTIGLTFILTVMLTMFTKKKRALHDFVAFSVVADEVHSVFYKDKEEELKYQKLSEQKLTNIIVNK